MVDFSLLYENISERFQYWVMIHRCDVFDIERMTLVG